MAIPESFISNTGSLSKFLSEIKTAGIPDRVTFEFLKTIGFKSSNDRPIIPIMKALGFLDTNGAPTETYKAYRAQDGAKVLARAIRSAYSDVFLANTKAESASQEKIKSIVASKTTKGATVIERIARTFLTLCKSADFSDVGGIAPIVAPNTTESPPSGAVDIDVATLPKTRTPTFHYNIEIHLPTTTDISVYNAIFKSLRENLL